MITTVVPVGRKGLLSGERPSDQSRGVPSPAGRSQTVKPLGIKLSHPFGHVWLVWFPRRRLPHVSMIAHGAFFPSLVCDPDVGWGPNGDRTATRLIVIGRFLAPLPLLAICVIVLALIGSFTVGLRLGKTLSNLVVIILLARRMDSAELTRVDTEWGPGGSTVVGSADAGSSQLEIVTKSRSELPFPGKGGDGNMTVQYLDP